MKEIIIISIFLLFIVIILLFYSINYKNNEYFTDLLKNIDKTNIEFVSNDGTLIDTYIGDSVVLSNKIEIEIPMGKEGPDGVNGQDCFNCQDVQYKGLSGNDATLSCRTYAGEKGYQGINGTIGNTGDKGDIGNGKTQAPRGPQGIPGYNGHQGNNARYAKIVKSDLEKYKGIQGQKGASGANGMDSSNRNDNIVNPLYFMSNSESNKNIILGYDLSESDNHRVLIYNKDLNEQKKNLESLNEIYKLKNDINYNLSVPYIQIYKKTIENSISLQERYNFFTINIPYFNYTKYNNYMLIFCFWDDDVNNYILYFKNGEKLSTISGNNNSKWHSTIDDSDYTDTSFKETSNTEIINNKFNIYYKLTTTPLRKINDEAKIICIYFNNNNITI